MRNPADNNPIARVGCNTKAGQSALQCFIGWPEHLICKLLMIVIVQETIVGDSANWRGGCAAGRVKSAASVVMKGISNEQIGCATCPHIINALG